MPKITNTRKLKVKELLERLNNGPCFNTLEVFDGFTPKQIERVERMYKLWSSTWIIPACQELLKKDLQ